MDIVTMYVKSNNGIEGIPLKKFQNSLMEMSKYSNSSLVPGIIMDDGKVIGCILKYYLGADKRPHDKDLKGTSKLASSYCYKCLKTMGISNKVKCYDCVGCHLYCLENLRLK